MKRILIGGIVATIVGLSTNLYAVALSWAASGDQRINLNSANVNATVTVNLITQDVNIRNLDFARDGVRVKQEGTWTVEISGTATVAANQSGEWKVEIKGTPSIRSLSPSLDGIKIYGDKGLPVEQDSSGKIYTISASETGNSIRRVYSYVNVSGADWVEVGSYTVSANKTLKIYDVVATGRFGVDYKIFTGTVGQELYLATSPSFSTAQITISRPLPVTGGTIVKLYVKPDTAVNDGTITIGGVEY